MDKKKNQIYVKIQRCAAISAAWSHFENTDTSLYSHTPSSSTGLYMLSLNFCISPSVEFSFFLTLLYTPHFRLLQSPRYLHLLQRRHFFSNFTKVIWFQTGIKVCQLLYNNYVALFKCSLSLLDEKLCDFMLSKNTRRQYVCIFRCLGFL